MELGGADFLGGGLFLAVGILLYVRAAVAVHLGHELGRKGVDHRGAHAVQAAGDLVALAAEFAAGMQRGHDRLERGDFCLLVDVYRDAAAVVGDAHPAARQQNDLDVVGKAAHRLVARVIKNLPDKMMQAVGAGGADVHAGAPAHRLEPLEYGNVLGAITTFDLPLRGCLLCLFFVIYFSLICSHKIKESGMPPTLLFYQISGHFAPLKTWISGYIIPS